MKQPIINWHDASKELPRKDGKYLVYFLKKDSTEFGLNTCYFTLKSEEKHFENEEYIENPNPNGPQYLTQKHEGPAWYTRDIADGVYYFLAKDQILYWADGVDQISYK